MAISNSESQLAIESVKCDSCGFTEECTLAYISRIRERYNGRWICGLCVEAVKDEVVRSDRLITIEEALNRHIDFCKNFQSSSMPSGETEHPISAMGKLLRRSLDSPKALQSMPSSPIGEVHRRALLRSDSCFSSLSQ